MILSKVIKSGLVNGLAATSLLGVSLKVLKAEFDISVSGINSFATAVNTEILFKNYNRSVPPRSVFILPDGNISPMNKGFNARK
eukprot:2056450-Karenia_brevis.AAC.1